MTNEQKQQHILGLRGTLDDKQIRKEIRELFGVKKSQANIIFTRIFRGSGVSTNVVDDPERRILHDTKSSCLDDVLKELRIDTKLWNVTSCRIENRYNKEKGDYFSFAISIKKDTRVTMADEMLKSFVEQANVAAPKAFPQPKVKGGDYLYHINIPDFHLGRLSWGQETGAGDYDLNIAAQDYYLAVSNLMKKAPVDKIESIVYLVGSDFFNTDTVENTTTKGTRQDVDSRWFKAFTKGCEIITNVVQELSSKVPVFIIVCNGNHDVQKSAYLGSYLTAFFRNCKNVTVNNEPSQRKYYGWGKSLLGFTHGDNEKVTDLPQIMFHENMAKVSEYKTFHWFLGHVHHESVKEIHNVKIRTVASLAQPDAWTASQGYVGSTRGAQGFLFDREEGLIATYYHNADFVKSA